MHMFEEMQAAGINPDRVTYNTLLDIYGKAGRLDDALRACSTMERAGWTLDVVSPLYCTALFTVPYYTSGHLMSYTVYCTVLYCTVDTWRFNLSLRFPSLAAHVQVTFNALISASGAAGGAARPCSCWSA